MAQRPDDQARPAAGHEGEAPEPLPDDVARKALRGDPEAETAVEERWDQAKSMEGEAPTG
jgi:hypothetical protein